MADNDAKILRILEKQGKALESLQTGQKALQADVSAIKTEHGKKLDALQEDVTIVKGVTAHTETAVKALDAKVDATRSQLERKINKLPHKAD